MEELTLKRFSLSLSVILFALLIGIAESAGAFIDSKRAGWSPFVGPSDNTLKWVKTIEPEPDLRMFNILGGTLGPEETLVIFKHPGDSLYIFDSEGNLRWSRRYNRMTPIGASQEELYFERDNEILALDLDNNVRWSCEIEGIMGFLTAHSGTSYFESWDAENCNLHAITDGMLKWSYAVKRVNMGMMGMPAVDNHGVYFYSPENLLLALDHQGKLKWTYPVKTGAPVLGNTGTIYYVSENTLLALSPDGILKSKRIFSERPRSLAISQNELLYTSIGNALYALTDQGIVKWDYLAENDIIKLSVDREGNVYFITPTKLYSLDQWGASRWTYEFDNLIWPFERPIIGHDGTLYIIGTDEIYAFGTPTKAAAFGLWLTFLMIIVLAIISAAVAWKRRRMKAS